jgi:metallophosphoesterase (TIGR00282 family)
VITTGNHVFRQRSIYPFLEECPYLLRPANYPAAAPGMGYGIYPTPAGRLLVINVLGVVYMESLASPFDTVDALLAKLEGKYDLAVMDVHAEATSEKIALARYFDGRLNAVFGTHTHVPTADMQILPKGTGYVTDLGMTGPRYSVLGIKPELSISKFRGDLYSPYRWADGPTKLEAVLFTIDTDTGLCKRAERVDYYEDPSQR